MTFFARNFLSRMLIVSAICLVPLASGVRAAGDETVQRADETHQQLGQLFERGDWKALEEMGSRVVQAYETDPNQFAPMRAFFYVLPNNEKPETLAGYNAWVTQFPSSYAALYARARYYAFRALATRGGEFIDKVPADALDRMGQYFSAARADLHHSLTLSSRPVMSYFQLLRIERYYGRSRSARKYYEASTRFDPDVLVVAQEYLYSLQPRWGGSFRALHAFPEEAKRRGLSPSKAERLKAIARFLEGQDYVLYGDTARAKEAFAELADNSADNEYKAYSLVELAHFSQKDHDYEAASRYLKRALALGTYDVRVLVELAATSRDANRPKEALAFYDQAIARGPNDMWALSGRGWLNHAILGNDAAAFPDILKAATLGEAFAQNVLGHFYWEGKVVAKSEGDALYWWTLSAKQKNGMAEANLQMAKQRLGKDFDSILDAALRARSRQE
jgi:tetratricopeptide (TPR) repeat protein